MPLSASEIQEKAAQNGTQQRAGGLSFALTPGGNIPANLLPRYKAYTPTWTSTGAAPAFGDATILARFAQIGKVVHAYGKITFGAATTYGTGNYAFAVPVTAAASAQTAGTVGYMFLYDSSANNSAFVPCTLATTATMRAEFGATYFGTDTMLSATAPFTWASGDIFDWNITYEAA